MNEQLSNSNIAFHLDTEHVKPLICLFSASRYDKRYYFYDFFFWNIFMNHYNSTSNSQVSALIKLITFRWIFKTEKCSKQNKEASWSDLFVKVRFKYAKIFNINMQYHHSQVLSLNCAILFFSSLFVCRDLSNKHEHWTILLHKIIKNEVILKVIFESSLYQFCTYLV